MSKIERTIVIDRPNDEVFRFVHEPRNDASWQTTLIESTQLDGGPLGVGTQLRERRRFLGRLRLPPPPLRAQAVP